MHYIEKYANSRNGNIIIYALLSILVTKSYVNNCR